MILQCILGFHSQSIDFTNYFDQSYIPIVELVLIEILRDLDIDGGKGDVVLRLKKSIYGQAEYALLWYEKL